MIDLIREQLTDTDHIFNVLIFLMLSKEAKPAVYHTADPSPLPTCSQARVSLRQPLIV